jgi:hypothetical protein
MPPLARWCDGDGDRGTALRTAPSLGVLDKAACQAFEAVLRRHVEIADLAKATPFDIEPACALGQTPGIAWYVVDDPVYPNHFRCFGIGRVRIIDNQDETFGIDGDTLPCKWRRDIFALTGVLRRPPLAGDYRCLVMSNRYGITLDSEWLEWAAKEKVSETVAAAVLLICRTRPLHQVVETHTWGSLTG